MAIAGIPEGYTDPMTGQKIFYHDEIEQQTYEENVLRHARQRESRKPAISKRRSPFLTTLTRRETS